MKVKKRLPMNVSSCVTSDHLELEERLFVVDVAVGHDAAQALEDRLQLLHARLGDVEPAGESVRVLQRGRAVVQVVDHVVVRVALAQRRVPLSARGARRRGSCPGARS